MKVCAGGHPLNTSELDSLCPECVFGLVERPLLPFGRFERLRTLGNGGFGQVFLARESGHSTLVALKVISQAHLEDPVAWRDFRQEIEILEQLDHPGIVRLLKDGEHEGRRFYVMEYLPGGTLRERMGAYRADPRRAAELMVQVADAVDYLHRDPARAHRKPVLHRDLKPENILFDEQDRPKLVDFGIAARASTRGWSAKSRLLGTVGYMAPEQLHTGTPQTPAADVYSLGAMLYELFTDGPPRRTHHRDTLRLPRGFDRRLEAVVLNAIEPDPRNRYASARAFAQDLQRALAGKPIEEIPTSPGERLRTAIRRRGTVVAVMALAVAFALDVFGTIRAERGRERESADRQARENAAMASVQAVAFSFQLREYANRVAALSRRPEIVALLAAPEIQSPSTTLIERAHGFDTLFVIGADGRQRARTTHRTYAYLTRSFAFRDYFREARRLGSEVCPNGQPGSRAVEEPRAYVGRAHVSESDGSFEIAISAPICDARGWIGMIGATLPSNRVFGSVKIEDPASQRITALIGPRDVERKDAGRPPPNGFTFIAHPKLQRGTERQLLYPAPSELRDALGMRETGQGLRYVAPLVLRDYRDPLAEKDASWSAAFAPVDATGFVVVVQSRTLPDRAPRSILAANAVPLGVHFMVGLGFLLSVRAALRRRWS